MGWVALHVALILLMSWMAAGLLNGMVIAAASPATQGRTSMFASDRFSGGGSPLRDYSLIIRKNIFNSESVDDWSDTEMSYASRDVGEIDSLNAPHTALNLKLMGTMVWDELRVAVILDQSNKENTYRLHDYVSGAEIVSIEPSRVALLNNGRLEALSLEYAGKESPVTSRFSSTNVSSMTSDVVPTGNGAMISKIYLESQLKNMNQLLTQVRAVPNLDSSGNTNGFKLFAIQKGSIFEKIGLSEQDVVQSINGVELNSAEKGLELFQVLRNESNFNVDVLRGGNKTTLRFSTR
ncbi:MAG: hypothetical protein OEZ04_02000 [Nitrospinota bacterium]|nr:hypothetical protein [Nitrospinota bacterium]